MMGKPQPLKKFPEKQPSFDVSTSNAIRIQRVPLFWVQQFIRKPPVFLPREICRIFLRPAVLSFYYIVFFGVAVLCMRLGENVKILFFEFILLQK